MLAASDDAPFKKDNLRILLARVLTRAIWNWIDNYPMEFVSLSQVTPLPGVLTCNTVAHQPYQPIERHQAARQAR